MSGVENCLAFELGRKCLAGEVCVVDEDCEAPSTCIPVVNDQGVALTICSHESANAAVVGFVFLITFMVIACLGCFYVAVKQARAVRRSIEERKRKKAAARVANSGGGGGELRRRALELLNKVIDQKEEVDAQFHNVRSLYVKNDMNQSLHGLTLVALSITNAVMMLGDEVQNFQVERRFLYAIAYIDQATRGVSYALANGDNLDNAKMALQQTNQLVARVSSYFNIPSPFRDVSIDQLLNLRHDDPNYGFGSQLFSQLQTRVLAMKPRFADEVADEKIYSRKWFAGTLRRYPFFYSFWFVMYLSIFLAFATKVGSKSNADLDQTDRSPNANVGDGIIFGGGFGQSFLAVPPQYQIGINNLQSVTIPILYGVMHCALCTLGLVPVPLARGLWRDIVTKFPSVRQHIPVDDLAGLHKKLGFLMLGLLLLGGFIWLATMVPQCLNDVPAACLSFTPAVKNQLDPVENVYMLRVTVVTLWPLLILMWWARRPCPWPLSVIGFFRNNWFEFCYYLHVTIANVSLVIALVGRTEVFYPVLFGFGFYWIDWIRETVFKTKNALLVDSQIFARTEDGRPTSMRLKFEPSGKLPVGAGQYIYVKIPAIDQVWHPFTLSSASNDGNIQLHVGIIAKPGDWYKGSGKESHRWKSKYKSWTYKLFDLVSRPGANVTAKVRGPYGSSFTSCFDPNFGGAVVVAAGTGLSAAESVLRESLERRKAGIKGPSKLWVVYSCRDEDALIWAWERIVSLLVKAVLDGVLDINTLFPKANVFDWLGITMYVTRSNPALLQQFSDMNRDTRGGFFNLRESIFNRRTLAGAQRPRSKDSRLAGGNMVAQVNPAYVGDVEAYGAPQLNNMRQAIQSIAVGQYTDLDLNGGLQGRRNQYNDGRANQIAQQVREWLLNKILAGSLDDQDSHIEKYLANVKETLRQDGGNTKMSVSFCGPTTLAATISDAIKKVASDTKVEWNAEHQ
ncbi:Superoxide-generating NADPH oxidase heavy chain subunit B (NADPH oxidase B) (Superoxide-generating NADPH oxidase flavocytochrome B) [Durusdinium trenchii]|uniref:Superoxide-generating NADPH oxidase heavy chain subunit B (NADPH oxidase B) (Superoxide-generating NADPH oxidase flavocytochrome B) n=1 Tax=Durusdinium trenchii TaxID=1381693 RepID=A0ABP0R2Q0_9DINO